MFCTNVFSKTSLKLKNPRTHPTLVGKYSASKNFYGRVDFFLSEKRLIDSDELSQLIGSPILSRLGGFRAALGPLFSSWAVFYHGNPIDIPIERSEASIASKSRKKRAEMKPNATDRFLNSSKY